jgi:Putative transposase
VFSLQTVPAREGQLRKGVAQYAGFSLQAGIGVGADQREKLERLARYVSRPPVSVERLSLTARGQVRYRVKTPYRDRTTDIVLEAFDFIARLAALVPPPRAVLRAARREPGICSADALQVRCEVSRDAESASRLIQARTRGRRLEGRVTSVCRGRR